MGKSKATSNFLLVIDANKYLDLYRSDTGLKVLKYLTRVSEHIFITKQLADEVNRNKVKTISDYLSHKAKMLSIDSIKIPEHLAIPNFSDDGDLSADLNKIKRAVAEKGKQLKEYSSEVVRQTANSADEVSLALTSVFERAIEASSEELERARSRKELGNPPGKRGPLGDELLWEQVLTNLNGKKFLWLITSDSDFCTMHNGELYLNALLMREIKTLPKSPEVFLFDKLVEGIQHFAKNNNIDLDIELTEDELDEITDEEQALIIADQIREFNERSSIGIAQSIASQMAALNDFESFKNSMTAQSQWGGDVYRALQGQLAFLKEHSAIKDIMKAQSLWNGEAQRAAAALEMAIRDNPEALKSAGKLQAKARKISKKPPDAESDSEE